MQVVRLTIPGTYYDSQIYAGRLYLWTRESSIITINWDSLVDSISLKVTDVLKFAAHCAFRKSNYLYSNEWKLFIQDVEMKNLLFSRFQELSNAPIEFSENDLQSFIIREQDNPFNFPHADSLFYYKTLYVGNSKGIQSSTHGGDRYPINPSPIGVWDGPVLSMAANFSTLALASGNEGLFEYDIENKESQKPYVHQILSNYANEVHWLYASLFGSSYGVSYLADFDLQRTDRNRADRPQKKERIFRETIPSSILFNQKKESGLSRYTWGVHDKMCMITNNDISIAQYTPIKKGRPRFSNLGTIQAPKLLGRDIVRGDSALFGYIIESEDGLLIINSLMEDMWLEGEPVNWRVFPDSRDYTNQLHVVYDDKVCIYSFNQDYFVDQDKKTVGIRKD